MIYDHKNLIGTKNSTFNNIRVYERIVYRLTFKYIKNFYNTEGKNAYFEWCLLFSFIFINIRAHILL